MNDSPPRSQMVWALFGEMPTVRPSDLADRASEILGTSVAAPPVADSDAPVALLMHHDVPVEFADGTACLQTALLGPQERDPAATFASEIEQSWHEPDASILVEQSKFSMLVTEMFAHWTEAQTRLSSFHAVLQAIVELSQPTALVFVHSQQVVSSASYLASCDRPVFGREGALNVRLFTIAGTESEAVMDTRGLTEIGLPDLQCHFHGLDLRQVSQVLFNTGYYIAEHGPVIESGQTVEGTEPGSMWQCQYEVSMVAPERDVLDLNPGTAAAAGDRT